MCYITVSSIFCYLLFFFFRKIFMVLVIVLRLFFFFFENILMPFTSILKLVVSLFFRKTLIPCATFILELFFTFLIKYSRHFYIYEKNIWSMFLFALKNNLYGLDINYLKIWLKLINCFKYNIFCFKILEVCFTSIGMWNSRHWYSKFKKLYF